MRLHRESWSELTAEFARFFAPFGEVATTDDAVIFAADPATVATGLELRKDGSSSSFMPLHEMAAGWDEVVFDAEGATVTVLGETATYVYRVPPGLRPHEGEPPPA